MRNAFAAVKALVEKLGVFLSPHLSSLLALLLRPGVAISGSPVADIATGIRSQLPAAVPARLMLPALLGHLPLALQVITHTSLHVLSSRQLC